MINTDLIINHSPICGLKLITINTLTKEFDFEITNWYYKTKLYALNCNYKALLYYSYNKNRL